MLHAHEQRDERGAALVFVAISIVALLLVAALVIDGSFDYSNFRQMQNAADSSAMAGARAIQQARFGGGPVTGTNGLVDTVNKALSANGASDSGNSSLYDCRVFTLAQAELTTFPNPTTLDTCASVTAANVNNYVGVWVRAGEQHSTLLGRIGNSSGTQVTRARAAASVQRSLDGGDGPWMVCGNSALGGYNFLLSDGTLRSDALLQQEYGANGTLLVDPDGSGPLPKSFPVHGKLEDGAPPTVADPHCGGGPGKGLGSQWKGLIDPDDVPVTIGDVVGAENGKKVGHYKYEDTLADEQGCPPSENNVNDVGGDDFSASFDQCLVGIPIFDDVLGGERVHIQTIAVFRLFYMHTGTVKYYAQFVCARTCNAVGGPTGSDPSLGGIGVIKLLV
jgi:hypothetical protein